MAQQILNAIFIGSIYALFAVGYTLVFGVLDVLNLAHSAVFMLGAVFAYSLVALHGVPFLPAAVIAILACGVLGLVVEYVALRPLRRRQAPPISALISTIGLALIFVAIVEQATPGTLFAWLWQDGANSVRFPTGAVPNPTFHVAGLTIEAVRLGILATSIVLMLLLGYVIRFTQAGRALRAVAENRRAAALLGINVDRLFASTLFLSSALGGLAGILFGLAVADISPYIGRDQVELKGLAVIVLGGMGSIPGAVLGGYLLGLIEVLAFVRFGSNVEAGVAFAALFLMLVVRPQGLFGARLRERL
ncbi:MAG TPA: branched-chain amino acid ABC transporter permease [Candidatus Limnocylindrales bacterium]|nr:branched-chain amino acid ABC transporter permease [Candidatus Limnocylindrales bacterium]